jgi:mono/diheme cytochrome c family protein
MLVHFPIGILIGGLIMESWNRSRGKQTDYSGLVYLGALTALLSATMGGLLKASGDYAGDLVDQHQFSGYLTAALALLTAFLYWKRAADRIAYLSLWVTCISVGIAGHLGAGLTHGQDYLYSVLPWNRYEPTDPAMLQAFQAFADSDSFPQDQLDRLNLEVRAVFAHNCYQCHSTEKRKGDLALDHEEGVFAGGENGPILVSGAADESEIIRRLELPRSHDDAMPPKGKVLQKEEIALIRLWIDQGAHWADSTLKIFREAELALVQPDVPDAPTDITHPIDRFVHQYFAQNKLEWPESIDDRQFIRRAYLDISGLLPAPEEVTTFLADKHPDKRSRLIDTLLEDKQAYALHWLSFWNDLLRNDYSGTGFITGGRKQITEWLYTALLEDKPYNQMASELINPGPESEGFVKGIKWRGEVNASQRTELQAAQNISQSLLGLNLKCASCHNSFVNNLTLDQAYGFANIFAEKPLEIHRCDKPTGRIAETTFLYPQLGEVNADSLKERLQQLAEVIVQPANGRLYRTVVNRFWDRLLGRGLTAPVDEMDNLPWSQDLLDWLAADFMDHGYDFHHLLKRIMTSRAYQLPAVAYPSPEYLASEKFVFQGPAVRRLTAEQFVDAFSQVVSPFYYGVAFDPQHRQVEAQWIWHEEIELDRRVLPKPGERRFRKRFSISRRDDLQKAEVLITADHSYTFWLNAGKISTGADWRAVQQLEIPVDILQTENIIAIAGENEGVIPNPAGLLFSLRLQYTDGSEEWIHSDRSWRSTADTPAQDWTALQFDDLAWKDAWRAGSFSNSYWGSLLNFTFSPDSIDLPFARASLVRQDDFMKTLGRPVRENVTTKRSEEATLLQSLMLTNSSFFHEYLARGATSWLQQSGEDHAALIDQLYLKALGRLPVRKEKKLLLKKLEEEAPQEALEDIIWTLVLLPEFQLI